MKIIFLLTCAFAIFGCTSSIPVRPTGTPNEYVVVARNNAAVFSSLELAQKESESIAIEYCRGMGKSYVKKYAIDRPMAIAQVPESTLYFTCSTKEESVVVRPSINEASDSVRKLEDLNTMLKKGLITEEEYNTKKQEILKNM